MKNICVALDFSDVMDSVLVRAKSLAKAYRASVYLIHVMEETPAYGMYGFSPEEIPMVGPTPVELFKALEERMDKIAADFIQEGIETRAQVIEGDPLEEILRYSQTESSDVIVVGAHEHGLFASMLLGNLAESLIRKSLIPILVIPYVGEKK